jgi:putative transcriptional regulator
MTKRSAATKHDWSRLDAMTEAEKHAAALTDPDNRPLSERDMQRMRRTPRTKIIRRALGLSQEDFAARYRIPLGTLRDWEQGRAEPDQAARAYLTVIAREPDVVCNALKPARYPDRVRHSRENAFRLSVAIDHGGHCKILIYLPWRLRPGEPTLSSS